jgi:UPF0755 protein
MLTIITKIIELIDWLKLKLGELETKLEPLRLKIATHPKVIIWRLHLFGVHPSLGRHFLKIISGIVVSVLIFGFFYTLFWRSPRPFPQQALITVEKGESLTQVANDFENRGVIISSFWLKTFIVILGGQKRVIAGDYYFPDAVSLFKVAEMIHSGKFGLIAKKITLPEGSSSFEMAKILEKELPAFKSTDFLNEVQDNNYEGYLFPDTYFLTPNTKSGDVILMMRENFARQIELYQSDILKSKKSMDDIVRVASIIEEESNSNLDNKRIVSGIIWKRLRLGMPLQVDSAFSYYNGKNSYTLTKADLTENHDYNTYLNKGLPPTAITNPGIDSLRAAIAPTQTEYLYFLSDKQGGMHYAKTFEQHKVNRAMYLN